MRATVVVAAEVEAVVGVFMCVRVAAAVLVEDSVVTVVLGVAVPVPVVVCGALVVLAIIVINAVDVAALVVLFTVFVGESVLFWETMVEVSLIDARIVVWNVFGVLLPVFSVASREEVLVAVAPAMAVTPIVITA